MKNYGMYNKANKEAKKAVSDAKHMMTYIIGACYAIEIMFLHRSITSLVVLGKLFSSWILGYQEGF